MNRLIFAFIFAFSAAQIFAALPTTLAWEIRSGGAAANGGGFNPGNANFPTDATATSATGNAPVISSATYNFVAGDVGAWVYIKAGTNWTAGYYKISSVAANAATVNATIGAAVQVTNGKYAVNTVAGVATTASPTGGTFGVDFSQQNAAKLSITDAASIGASTNLTSVAAGFTPVMVGNLFQLTTTGTGAHGIIGWYEIVSYTNASTVVTDVTTNDGTALVAGTGAVGGGILRLGAIGSATARLGAVAGNYIFINGSFSTASDTFSCLGTATNPIQVIGYGTLRGDGYSGRTATTAKNLITTNFPSYQYTATNKLTASSATFVLFENINFSVAGAGFSGPAVTSGTDDVMTRCVVTNPSTNTLSAGISNSGNRGAITNNDIFMSGGSGGATGAGIIAGSAIRVIGNYVQMSASTSAGPAINAQSSSLIEDNTLIGNGGPQGIYISPASAAPTIRHNTIVGFVDGIGGITALTGLQYIEDNMITENTGTAINFADAGAAVFLQYNRRRDLNTVTNATNWVNATSFNEVTTDTGGSETDYVSYAGQDLRLIAASPGNGTAFPSSASMGSRQLPATSSAVQTSSGYAK